VDLSEEALKRLHEMTQRLITVGDVWWLPRQHVGFFPSDKDRFCLVAGIETPTGGTPLVVHLIAGSTKSSTGTTTIYVVRQDCGLNQDTYFKFRWSGTVSSSVLATEGDWKGRLPADRMPEIEAAIKASRLVALKRLWS
jgi:mRNA-degrading endonuclease toxin of MazEF toxin-antitoxin module